MSSIPWYENRQNLAELLLFLDAVGLTPTDGVPYLLEKPWKWNREWAFCSANPQWHNYSDERLETLRIQIETDPADDGYVFTPLTTDAA